MQMTLTWQAHAQIAFSFAHLQSGTPTPAAFLPPWLPLGLELGLVFDDVGVSSTWSQCGSFVSEGFQNAGWSLTGLRADIIRTPSEEICKLTQEPQAGKEGAFPSHVASPYYVVSVSISANGERARLLDGKIDWEGTEKDESQRAVPETRLIDSPMELIRFFDDFCEVVWGSPSLLLSCWAGSEGAEAERESRICVHQKLQEKPVFEWSDAGWL